MRSQQAPRCRHVSQSKDACPFSHSHGHVQEADIRRKAEQAEQSEAEKRLKELQERSKREQEK